MSTVTDYEIDKTKLNATARRRLEHGIQCFARPTVKGDIEAVCVDFGLTARAETLHGARELLEEAINTVFQMAEEDQALEELLNRADNSEAKWLLIKARIVFAVIVSILWPLVLAWTARGWYARLKQSFEVYEEPTPRCHSAAYC